MGLESLPRSLREDYRPALARHRGPCSVAPIPAREGSSARQAFTLIEVVLAIGLSAVVMFLLTTAIELYMVRVDSSRGRVESAQLARAILDQMAADLAATRLYAPPVAATGGQGAQDGGGQSGQQGQQSQQGQGGQAAGGGGQNPSAGSGYGGGQSGGGGGGASGGMGTGGAGGATSGSELAPPTEVQGLYGTATELRIDRSAPANWQRASRMVEATEPTTAADMPRSVRYYLVEGSALSALELAQRGVNVEQEAAASISGLYRETIATAALSDDADPLASPGDRDGAIVELLAPEVVKLEIQYFDGGTLVDDWDALQEGSLPAGVEILLTLHEPRYGAMEIEEPRQTLGNGRSYPESELVEYRRFVRLPTVSPPQPASLLLPEAGGQAGGGQRQGGQSGGGGSGEGNQSGQGGTGQGEGNQNGGGNGANGGGNSGGQQGGGNGR